MLTQKFLELFLVGAEWVTWLLVATSVVGLAVIIDRVALLVRTRERFAALRRAVSSHISRGDTAGAVQAVEGDSLVRNVVRSGLELVARGERRGDAIEQAMLGALAEQRARYEARLSALVTIGNVGPLVGLLGTVIGIVVAFYQLGRTGSAQAASNTAVMTAIGEALVTTGLGIAVAVPAVVVYNLIRGHLAERMKQSEALQREVIASVDRLAAGRAAEA